VRSGAQRVTSFQHVNACREIGRGAAMAEQDRAAYSKGYRPALWRRTIMPPRSPPHLAWCLALLGSVLGS